MRRTAAHIDNLLHLQQHHSCQFVAEKCIITNTCVLGISGSIDDWHILKRGHLLKHYQIQLYHWYCDFCLYLYMLHCRTQLWFLYNGRECATLLAVLQEKLSIDDACTVSSGRWFQWMQVSTKNECLYCCVLLQGIVRLLELLHACLFTIFTVW